MIIIKYRHKYRRKAANILTLKSTQCINNDIKKQNKNKQRLFGVLITSLPPDEAAVERELLEISPER